MGCFSKALPVILKHEGGFSDHKDDPGKATNFGISLRWLKTEGLYGDLDDDGDVDIDDIKAIDFSVASRIYREKWWNRNHYDRIKDCDLATKVFDMCINMGSRQAHKIVQRSLSNLGNRLVVDGIIGPVTMTLINTVNTDALLEAIRDEQRRFYLRLIDKKPSLSVFKKGWLRRAAA